MISRESARAEGSAQAVSPTDAHVEPARCTAVLTHHWLVRRRGGEQVLSALAELLPGAPLYTLVHDPDGAGHGWPEVRSSFLARIPGALRHYPKLLPLMPWAARSMRLPPVDLVVCSDAAIAKTMRPDPRSRVVCYCHSPMRYIYEPHLAREYAATLPAVLRRLWPVVAAYVRRADLRAAQRVDQFVANSKHVAERIRRHYGRESIVVYPPVDLPDAPSTTRREKFYLWVGHHVAYKRLDLAIAACGELGRELVVIGDGPAVDRLSNASPPQVRLLGWQPDEVVRDCYRRAQALLFPGEEDFGIVPVEAMAHGCPVVAYALGGALETVIPDHSGVLFQKQEVAALVEAMQQCERRRFDPREMLAHARQFSRPRFLKEMRAVVTDVLARPRDGG